jgi:hypothetical protein
MPKESALGSAGRDRIPRAKHQGFQSRIDGNGGERKGWGGAKGDAQRRGKSAASQILQSAEHICPCFLCHLPLKITKFINIV